MSDWVRRLHALRDLRVLRAPSQDPGLSALALNGLAMRWPVFEEPGMADFKITRRGEIKAEQIRRRG